MVNKSKVIVFAMTASVIAAFIGIILTLIYRKTKGAVKSSNHKATAIPFDYPTLKFAAQNTVKEICPIGDCKVNIITGDKDCPESITNSLTIDPSSEVCSAKYYCNSKLLPYAVQSDGGTNPLGVCPTGIACDCKRKPQCPYYITSYFNTSGGSAFNTVQSRTVFNQITQYTDLSGNTISQPPLQMVNATSNFCTISYDWSKLMSPSTCLNGVLAYIPNKIGNINFNNTLLGCVPGSKCKQEMVAIWDIKSNSSFCIADPRTDIKKINLSRYGQSVYYRWAQSLSDNTVLITLSALTTILQPEMSYIFIAGAIPLLYATTVKILVKNFTIGSNSVKVYVLGQDITIEFVLFLPLIVSYPYFTFTVTKL